MLLEFTPLEFETLGLIFKKAKNVLLEFTPLEFETGVALYDAFLRPFIRIYSVGV